MQKDAGIAAVLNALLPGLGWLYIESLKIGIASVFIDIGLFFWISTSSAIFPSIVFLIYWWIQIISVHDSISNTRKEDKLPIKKKKLVPGLLDILKE